MGNGDVDEEWNGKVTRKGMDTHSVKHTHVAPGRVPRCESSVDMRNYLTPECVKQLGFIATLHYEQ
ncbi:uncharacterized protein G2W53_034325 [Senna tora]|uniref:Uncharacterized protein n=1 Tax=Senna tora TaxID=362788 RepID=A0A834WDN0_9FABA|nr:uncharacterized protein G2W53_034325 [Senna tora]